MKGVEAYCYFHTRFTQIKKIKLICCFLYLYSLNVNAQVDKNNPHNSSLSDSITYIEKLNKGKELLSSNPELAIVQFNNSLNWFSTNFKPNNFTNSTLNCFQRKLIQLHYFLGVSYYFMHKADSSSAHYKKALYFQRSMGDSVGVAKTLNSLGALSAETGDYDGAIRFYQSSLQIREAKSDQQGVATCLNNIGIVSHSKGDVIRALEMYRKAHTLYENYIFPDGKKGDLDGIANVHANIANLYLEQKEFDKSLEYYKLAFAVFVQLKNNRMAAQQLSNIAEMHYQNKKFTESKINHFKSIELKIKSNDLNGIANSYMSLGNIYFWQDSLDKAIQFHKKSLELFENSDDQIGKATIYFNYAYDLIKKNDLPQSYIFLSKGMGLAKKINTPFLLKTGASVMVKYYKLINNHKLALEYYELQIKMRDSLDNESTRKASIKSQLKYEYEKQAAADSVSHAKESEIKNVQLQKQSAEIKAKKNQQYGLFGGLGLVVIFAGFMFNRYKITQKQKFIIEKQKDVVEEQKKLVEEKQKEILDSIAYARRIQMALIPTDKYIERILTKLRNHEEK